MCDNEDLDFYGSCLDEIALEGLDGITLSALWLRLSKRPRFLLPIDDHTKPFLWDSIVPSKDLQFYKLKEPRKPLVIFNRYDFVDLETGIITEPEVVPEDIYPIVPIKKQNVRGSCSSYHTREEVTSEIRSSDGKVLLKLEEVIERWGERLAIVASQELRYRVLVGNDFDPIIKLTDLQYLMLERIGRSRYHGEVTLGKYSLSVLKESPKNLHYQRKLLLAKHLIVKQIHYQRSVSGQTSNGMLLHLTRFYVERKPKFFLLLKQLCEILSKKPKQQETLQVLRTEMGMKEGSFKKMFQKHLLQLANIIMIPLREFSPGLDEDRYVTTQGKERMVKGLQLKPNIDIQNLGKEDEEEDEEEREGADESTSLDSKWPLYIDRPLLSQVFEVIEHMGPNGASMMELSHILGLPKLEIRLICRNLERLQVVTTIMKDMGRQRTSRIISRKFESVSELHQQLMEERRKILHLAGKDVSKDAVESTAKAVADSSVSSSDQNSSFELNQSKDSKDFSFIKEIETLPNVTGREKSHITYRMLRRANLILEAVQQERIIDDIFKLQKIILKEEAKEAYFRVDKKSVYRLINKLAKDGYIKTFKTVLRLGDKVKKLHLVCAADVTEKDQIVRSAIDQAKLKYFFGSAADKNKTSPKEKPSLPEVKHSIKVPQKSKTSEIRAKMIYMPSVGRMYGIEPKFVRMKLLHELLFYLVYDYRNTETNSEFLQLWEETGSSDQTEIILNDSNEETESNRSVIEEIPTERKKAPKIHVDEKSWKMFIPPLPVHKGWGKGWCLISDVLLRIPLSLFVRIVNITYKIEGLDVYLNDPVKKHHLIGHLPRALMNSLLYMRKYIFAIHANLERLAYIGVLSFGPHQHKEKDQVFVYIHTKGSLVDTTTSAPGYFQISSDQEYLKKTYEFKSVQDVEMFWFDLRQICLHTPLGVRPNQDQPIVLEKLHKKQDMIDACKTKTEEEIIDDGRIPGDGKGAGGFDSALFTHLKRNWCWVTMEKSKPAYWEEKAKNFKENTPAVPEVPPVLEGEKYREYLQKSQENSTGYSQITAKKRLSRLTKNTRLTMTSIKSNTTKGKPANKAGEDTATPVLVTLEPNLSKSARLQGRKKRSLKESSKAPLQQPPKKIVRIVTKKGSKRKPFYDEIDRSALRLQSKLRVSWEPQEDTFLLLCKVASLFLAPTYHLTLTISSLYLRDLLHEFVPISKNKTSKACQRRILYMLRNPHTQYNVSVFLGEAKQDRDFVEEFSGEKPLKKNEDEWNKLFRAVVVKLLEKFRNSSPTIKAPKLPSSIEDLHQQYNVDLTNKLDDTEYTHLAVKNIVDIHYSVVYTLILSSLCCLGDKANWYYHLYRIFQQYPDSLLRSVFACLHRNKLISRRKEASRHMSRILPQSTLPYQLSISFEHKLMTRYQTEIFGEAFELFSKLIACQQQKLKGQLSRGVNIFPDQEGGYTAAVVSLMATKRIVFDLDLPDQIVIFDADYYKSASHQQSTIMKRMHNLEETLVSEPKRPKKSSDCNPPAETPASPPKSKEPLQAVSVAQTTASAYPTYGWDNLLTNVGAFEECGNNIPSTQPQLETTVEEPSFPDTGSEISNDTTSTVNIPSVNRASRVALYMMRQQMKESPAEKVQHSIDYLVINSCTVFCRLSQNCHPNHDKKADGSEKDFPPPFFSPDHDYYASCIEPTHGFTNTNFLVQKTTISEIIQSQSRYIPQDLNPLDYLQFLKEDLSSDDEFNIVRRIYTSIEQHRELGITSQALKKTFSEECSESAFYSYLQHLIHNKLILKVGVSEMCYVATVHCRPWTIVSYCIPKEKRALTAELLEQELRHQKAKGSLQSVQPNKSTVVDQTLENPSTSSAVNLESNEKPSSSTPSESTAPPSKRVSTRISYRKHQKGHSPEFTPQLQTWDLKKVQFICPLWRKADGTLNHNILQSLLMTIMGYIMTNPGITFPKLAEKYAPALHPVHVLELTEILEKAGCLHRICVKRFSKPSLSSQRIPIIEMDTEYADVFSDNVMFEPDIECVIKLGQFNAQANKISGPRADV